MVCLCQDPRLHLSCSPPSLHPCAKMSAVERATLPSFNQQRSGREENNIFPSKAASCEALRFLRKNSFITWASKATKRIGKQRFYSESYWSGSAEAPDASEY